MKQLSWCLIGIAFAGIFGALATLAVVNFGMLLAHPPSPSWVGHIRYQLAVWLVLAIGSLASMTFLIRRFLRLRRDPERNVGVKPILPLLGCALVMAATSLLLPAVTGYGTIHYQWVLFGTLAIVAKLSSQAFAEHHVTFVWALTFLTNSCAFLIPSAVILAVAGRRWPRIYAVALIGWSLFYLASLFVLFPATDGP